ncbi:MAG TPA: type II secretion system F family protein [Anaerolineae bacterium]|jgi:tight adherence protein C|nr:type II secretion system F family protein [Anaerolineae bacterium]
MSDLLLPLLLALGIGGSILIVFVGLASRQRSDVMEERLGEFGTRSVVTLEEIELSEPFLDRVIKPMLRTVANAFGRLAPRRNIENIQHNLDLAGNPRGWTTVEFTGLRLAAALVLAALGLGLTLVTRAPIRNTILITAIAGALGYFIPTIWLTMRIRSRKANILKALPDALDLLTISVEAGLGFDAALTKVTEKWTNELSQAFTRALVEIRMGTLRRVALRALASRADVSELTSFVAAIIQADQLGVSLARVLHIQSEQMRIRRRQRAEELAHQAPIKMMIPLVFLIFPALFVVLLGPALPSLKTAFGGF